jgi:hypothetical protein
MVTTATRRPTRERTQKRPEQSCWSQNGWGLANLRPINWENILRFFNVNDSNLNTAANFAANFYSRV